MCQHIQKERLVLTVFNESDSERRSNELVSNDTAAILDTFPRNQFGLGIKGRRGLGIKQGLRTKNSNYVLKN